MKNKKALFLSCLMLSMAACGTTEIEADKVSSIRCIYAREIRKTDNEVNGGIRQ